LSSTNRITLLSILEPLEIRECEVEGCAHDRSLMDRACRGGAGQCQTSRPQNFTDTDCPFFCQDTDKRPQMNIRATLILMPKIYRRLCQRLSDRLNYRELSNERIVSH